MGWDGWWKGVLHVLLFSRFADSDREGDSRNLPPSQKAGQARSTNLDIPANRSPEGTRPPSFPLFYGIFLLDSKSQPYNLDQSFLFEYVTTFRGSCLPSVVDRCAT
jgi:hypothetical protein